MSLNHKWAGRISFVSKFYLISPEQYSLCVESHLYLLFPFPLAQAKKCLNVQKIYVIIYDNIFKPVFVCFKLHGTLFYVKKLMISWKFQIKIKNMRKCPKENSHFSTWSIIWCNHVLYVCPLSSVASGSILSILSILR